jgi:hypothetical protein
MREVLIVDDSSDVADSVAMMLPELGLDARACYETQTTIDTLSAWSPDRWQVR